MWTGIRMGVRATCTGVLSVRVPRLAIGVSSDAILLRVKGVETLGVSRRLRAPDLCMIFHDTKNKTMNCIATVFE